MVGYLPSMHREAIRFKRRRKSRKRRRKEDKEEERSECKHIL